MRSLRIAAVVGLIVLLNLGIGLHIARLPRQKTPVPVDEVKITAWVRDQALADLLRACERRSSGVSLDIQLFRTQSLLEQALVAAMTANHPPHIVEVTSHPGVSLNPNVFMTLDDYLTSDFWNSLHPAMLSYFEDDGRRWALPYGASVPVLFYNGVLLSQTSFEMERLGGSWDAVRTAARRVQDVGKARGREYRGLVVDRDVLWYWENMGLAFGREKESPRRIYDQVFQVWRAMIFDDGIMPGLEQHRALTDFVAGRAALLMASSDKFPLLARHIGGRFSFGAIPLPGMTEAIPKVYGLAAFSSSPERDRAVAACLEYAASPEASERVWADAGKIPARTDSLNGRAVRGPAPTVSGQTVESMGASYAAPLVDERLGGLPVSLLPASRRLALSVSAEEGERVLERLELSSTIPVEDVWLP